MEYVLFHLFLEVKLRLTDKTNGVAIMATQIDPEIGRWFKRLDLNELFEVVARDDDDKTIDIQYFNGEIEELDMASWQQLPITQAAAPEDWSGALEVEKYEINDRYSDEPESLDDALFFLDTAY